MFAAQSDKDEELNSRIRNLLKTTKGRKTRHHNIQTSKKRKNIERERRKGLENPSQKHSTHNNKNVLTIYSNLAFKKFIQLKFRF